MAVGASISTSQKCWDSHRSAGIQRASVALLGKIPGTGKKKSPAIQTGCLTYGPLNSQGRSRVTLAYDHRVMDGALVAGILKRLEEVLLETLRPELLQLLPTNRNIYSAAETNHK